MSTWTMLLRASADCWPHQAQLAGAQTGMHRVERGSQAAWGAEFVLGSVCYSGCVAVNHIQRGACRHLLQSMVMWLLESADCWQVRLQA